MDQRIGAGDNIVEDGQQYQCQRFEGYGYLG